MSLLFGGKFPLTEFTYCSVREHEAAPTVCHLGLTVPAQLFLAPHLFFSPQARWPPLGYITFVILNTDHVNRTTSDSLYRRNFPRRTLHLRSRSKCNISRLLNISILELKITDDGPDKLNATNFVSLASVLNIAYCLGSLFK